MWFLSVWAYYFLYVQLRIHFDKVQKVIKLVFRCELQKVDDYEEDLKKYLVRKQTEVVPTPKKLNGIHNIMKDSSDISLRREVD